MIANYFLIISLLILTSHLLILPLSKKRPVLVVGLEGALFVVAIFATLASLTYPFLYLLAVLFGFLFYCNQSWVVYGVSGENINNALERAIVATRAESKKLTNTYEIDDNLIIKITNLGLKTCYIKYKNKSKASTKKSKLTKEVFRKFVQNYFI